MPRETESNLQTWNFHPIPSEGRNWPDEDLQGRTEFGLQFLDARNAKGIHLRLASPSVSRIWVGTMIKMNEKQKERCIGMFEDWLHCLYLGSFKTRFEFCKDENGELRYIRAIQGHSGGMIISPRLMNYVMIPYRWKQFIHHVGRARDQYLWHAIQVTNHERLFPFSDNLTTLMVVVASELSEAQREGLTSSLSLKGLNITVYTFEAVTTVFVELFCTPKSSMENPSLRVSGHGSSMNKSFIVEECAEDEYGRWATDEVTGEQGNIDDERSCFSDMGGQRVCLAVQTVQGSPREEKVKAMEKLKVDSKGPKEHSLVENKHRILSGGQMKNLLGGPKERKARKAFQKAMSAFRKLGFRTHQPEKGAGKDFFQHNGRGGKEGWESDDWSSSLWPDESSTSAAVWSCTRAHTAWIVAVPLKLTTFFQGQPTALQVAAW